MDRHGGNARPQEWTARQLRSATVEVLAPRFLVRDRDEEFGAAFDRVAEGVGVRVIKDGRAAPNMRSFPNLAP